MELMFAPLKKYADFQGRARRSEYWLFFLFTLILGFVVGLIGGIASGGDPNSSIPLVLSGLLWVALIVPSLAVGIRRLHDTNRSGWWVLIALIPFIGGLVLLVFYVLDGTPGPNKFGPDPKGRGDNSAEVFA